MTVYTKETALYNINAIADDIEEARNNAENFITTDISGNGIWITPSDMKAVDGTPSNTTRGWHISNSLEYYLGTVKTIQAWIDDVDNVPVPTIRLGQDNSGHADFTPTGLEIFSDATSSAAEFGEKVRIGKTTELHIETRPDRMSFLSSGHGLPDISDTSVTVRPDVALPGEVAYLSTSEDAYGNAESTFYIVHSVVVQDLRFGNWKWWNRPNNNNMTLKWIGD